MNPDSLQQPLLEHIGIAVSAMTGVLAARGKRIDLFGVLVLALVTAYGGGTVRDLLAGDLPPIWVRSPEYLVNATLTAFITFFAVRLRPLPERVLLVADACALALFTLIGVRKGIDLSFAPVVAIMMGVITGVAGGIVRDVLLGEVPMVFRREIHLYATASLAGSISYLGLHALDVRDELSTAAGMILILALRLAGIRWKLSLPLLEYR